MRLQVQYKGTTVACLHGGMVQRLLKEDKENPDNNIYEDDPEATLVKAKERLPTVTFDAVSVADEEAIVKKQAEEITSAIYAEPSVTGSSVVIAQTPKNQAWAALRDNADLNGSWPDLKAALNKAVNSLSEDATASEIYDKAVELLS